MTALEYVLAVITALSGLGVMACTARGWHHAAAFLGGLGLFACSVWLLLRMTT